MSRETCLVYESKTKILKMKDYFSENRSFCSKDLLERRLLPLHLRSQHEKMYRYSDFDHACCLQTYSTKLMENKCY